MRRLSSSRAATATIACAMVCALALCLPTATALMHPHLMSNAFGTCYNSDVPDQDICYPLRCYHLFNITSGGSLSPTPLAKGMPQTYPKFTCTVATEYIYGAAVTGPATTCKGAVCTCTTGGATCQPGKLSSCWSHACV